MRILIWSDESYAAIPGGHRVQTDHTAKALRRLGVDVKLAAGANVRFEGFDVVHGFGMTAEGIDRAHAAGVPVVLSTIYWSKNYVLGLHARLPRRRRAVRSTRLAWSILRRGMRATEQRMEAGVIAKREAYESADLLLPNSSAEARTIRSELSVTTPMHAVPNGVDHRTFRLPDRETGRTGVLYVGRIEPHKNQLGLIEALADTDLPLTIVGPVHPHHLDYLASCREAASPTVAFIDGRDQAGLVSLYQRAAVHAMPSEFETTGLTSLEACLCGAAVVSTSRGYVHDYFDDLAHYCEPDDALSIRTAVEQALTTGGSAELRARILDRYTWDHTAEATLQAYEMAIRNETPVRDDAEPRS